MGVDWVEVSRGGSVTYHGLGQLIAYVHVHLKELNLESDHFTERLGAVGDRCFEDFNVDAGRVKGKTGVWVSSGKICAMGIAAKKFVSYHGIGLNFDVDLDCFKWIVPCGLQEPVASLSPLLGRSVHRSEVEQALTHHPPEWMRICVSVSW